MVMFVLEIDLMVKLGSHACACSVSTPITSWLLPLTYVEISCGYLRVLPVMCFACHVESGSDFDVPCWILLRGVGCDKHSNTCACACYPRSKSFIPCLHSYELILKEVHLLDYYGGMKVIDAQDYYAAELAKHNRS